MSTSSCCKSLAARFMARVFLGLAAIVLASTAWALDTDIAKAPLFTKQDTILPNLLFVLDDSGSMGWDYMPDEVNDNLGSSAYGHKTAQCNGVYYDPSYVYTPPMKSDGKTFFTAATFTAAWDDGFNAASSTTDLTNKYYYAYSGTQPKMGWTFTTTGPITSTTFYKECNSSVGSAPGSSVFTKVTMTSSSADAQNFANWYSFYRIRILMMKTAVGMAFKDIDDKYKVGYTTIHRKLPLLDVAKFDATQKGTFYTDLYAATAGNSTPLRAALSRAGQYYAKKAPGQTVDPVEYSCQHNFTLMSTDGYWNTGNEVTGSGASGNFGAYQLDNVILVGQQDGAGALTPYYDGEQVKTTEKYTWKRVDSTPTTTVMPRTVTSTSTPKYTTSTPKNSNTQTVKTSAGNTASTSVLSISGATRPGSTPGTTYPTTFSVVITTSTNHGYSVGDTIAITGLPAGFTSGTVTITARTSSTFTYSQSFTTRPNSYGGSGATAQKLSAGQCPSGQAYTTSQNQIQTVVGNVQTATTTTSVNSYVDTYVTTAYSTTNFTETITYLNGAVTSDTTASTTTANSPASTTSPTTTTGPTNSTTTAAPVNTTLADTVGSWTNVGAATTDTTCTATSGLPTTTSTGTTPPSSTTPVVTTNATVTTGPTTANGTAVSTVGATTQGTPTGKILSSTSSTKTGGSSNSLADVAMYYYMTDLRNSSLSNCTGALGTSVCADNVAASGDDNAGWQHMTFMGLGLGAGGSLTFDFNYPTQKSGDYYSILQGTKNWPLPAADMPTAIDDLWHASVNGRGRYFSVQNAKDLSNSLSAALDKIRATTGTASAAATSTLQPVQGDNDVFVAQFTTVTWVGDIKKYSIDPSSGAISPVPSWSVQTALEGKSPSARTIYYKASSGSTLKSFTSTNLSADGYLGFFSNFCTQPGAVKTYVPASTANPIQCSTLSTADTTAANTADNLVNYLRGDKTATYYRPRDKVLGDIINASPVFVGKPRNAYTENNYPTFASTNSGRVGVVYAAANDGMLHAFLQSTGEELWAYIPTPMLSKLYKLADNDYANYHDYYVDGTPTTGDAYFSSDSSWHTILVGGYKDGGQGYYALDITDPYNPKSLWEFSYSSTATSTTLNADKDLGLSYGNPIITKRADGTWIVAFTSGYNNGTNTSGAGDGNGHFYVVKASDGTRLVKLDTYTDTAGTLPAGTVTTPSGLTMINDWVDFDTENLAKRFYGVDILGNVWRFDIDSIVPPYNAAFLLAQLKDASGTAQPITTKPIVAQVTYNGTNYPIVYVATGKYLGTGDPATTTQQSSYAFRDPLAETGFTGYGNIRTYALKPMVTKTTTSSTVDWTVKSGWLYDYPTSGERANVNSVIALTSIVTATNVPSGDLCSLGGSSNIYNFDMFTGNFVKTYMGANLTVGITVVQLASDGANAGATEIISTNSGGGVSTTGGTGSKSQVLLRRSSWRELE